MLQKLRSILTEILTSFDHAKELVIDLRFNEGGYDPITLAIAGMFATERHVGERTAGFFSDSLPRFFPNGNRFNLSHQIYRDPQVNELEGQCTKPALIRVNPWQKRCRFPVV